MGLVYTCDTCERPISEDDVVEVTVRAGRTLDRSQPQGPGLAPPVTYGPGVDLYHVHPRCLAELQLPIPGRVELPGPASSGDVQAGD